MITITRRQARHLRGIFRRCVLGITHRGIPPLVLRAEGTQLRAQYRYATQAIEHVEPGTYPSHEAIALPLEALADFEGRAESPVILEAAAPDRTVVRFEDRGIPQSREYTVRALDSIDPLPDLPGSWVEVTAGLLDALAEAERTSAEDSTRYALNCLQLKGDTHEIVATDGRQLLVSDGFPFPWSGDVLIRRSPVFASKDLPRDQPVMIGKTDTHVVFRVGPWTLFSEIQTKARFPRVDQALPDAQATATRLRLDAEDAAFLGQALDRLPGAEELNSPATLDCNGRIAVRARAADQTQVTELVLSRSHYAGTPVRLNTNREFLARAIRLGFTEVEITDDDTPLVCRAGSRVFAWQPLSKDSALEPADDVIRIESAPNTTPAAIRPDEPPPPVRINVNERTKPTKQDTGTNGTSNGHIAPESPGPSSLAALITESEALHQALTDARARAGRLVVALRRYRKRERLMTSALESLKQLKLQEVAEQANGELFVPLFFDKIRSCRRKRSCP